MQLHPRTVAPPTRTRSPPRQARVEHGDAAWRSSSTCCGTGRAGSTPAGRPSCSARWPTSCSALDPAGPVHRTLADADAAAVHLPLPPPPDDPGARRARVGLARLPRRPRPRRVGAGRPLADRLAGYLVTESIPTDYGDNQWAATRDWPDGARSPGVVMLTLMEKPERMTDAELVPPLVRHPDADVDGDPAPHPVRAQRGGPAADRRTRRPTAASSRRRGRRSSTSTTRCSSTAPTATRRSWPPT